MAMFDSKSGTTVDLRKVPERRTQELKWRHDRRVRPDRRLNNISVEWIPFGEVSSHPAIREALCCRNNRNQAKEAPRKKEPPLAGIYENQWSPLVNRRIVADRRTRQQGRPYNLRKTPDRRLNNIFVEWIFW
jgi:hypothetical protein